MNKKLVILGTFGCLLFLGLIGNAAAWVPTPPPPEPPPVTWHCATSGTLLEGVPFGGSWSNTYYDDSVCWSGLGEIHYDWSPYVIFKLYFNYIYADLVAIDFTPGNPFRTTTITVKYTDGSTFEEDHISVGYSEYALDSTKRVRWVQLSYKAPVITLLGANINGRAQCDFDYCNLRSS